MTPVTPSGVDAASVRDDTAADLPAALRAATAAVIIDRGLGAFSLREVARRAGVSHAAPGYHFGDMRGLLTSLAVEGLTVLHRETARAAADHDDPVERLTAIGVAYVRVGKDYPAHMEVVFRPDLVETDRADMQQCGMAAFSVVESAVQALADDRNPDLDVRLAAQLCWSAMQGLVQIHPKLTALNIATGHAAQSTTELVERFTEMIVNGIT